MSQRRNSSPRDNVGHNTLKGLAFITTPGLGSAGTSQFRRKSLDLKVKA